MATETLSQDLADLLATKNFDVKYTDEKGQDSSAADAKVFAFDWVASSGRNYGTVVIVLGDNNDLQMFFGDNLGKTMEDPQDKLDWFGSERHTGFLEEISRFATGHGLGTFSPKNINQLRHTMRGMAAIKEGLFEGYYGTRTTSYMGQPTEARLVIKHNRAIGENDQRFRYVESLYIETADQERFKLPFTKLSGGRAMLEHVRQGGRPYDIRGQHIAEMVQEINLLARFNRASQQRVFEGVTEELVNEAQGYYHQLQDNLRQLAVSRGYQEYFESWSPADIGSEDALVEDLKTLFIEQTLDARIEAALPTLAKIQQRGRAMKEAQIFENWADRLVEGTWALPDTPEAQAKLDRMMSQELIVGPDATNATEQLYHVIGDDELFDILEDLASRDPRANIWDDTDVQARLAELGIQTPASTEAEPRDVEQDTAPARPEQGVAEGSDVTDYNPKSQGGTRKELLAKYHKTKDPKDAEAARRAGATQKELQGVAEGYDDEDEGNPVMNAIINRIMRTRPDLLKHDLQKLQAAIRDVATFVGDVDEIGTSDVSGWVKQVEQHLSTEMTDEGVADDAEAAHRKINIPAALRKKQGGDWKVSKKDLEQEPARHLSSAQGLDALKQQMGMKESMELHRIKALAQVPVKEGVLLDEAGETLEHILDRFKYEVKQFQQTGDFDPGLYDALFDYYVSRGDMPYHIAKGHGFRDPANWISDQLSQHFDAVAEGDNLQTFETQPVAEGSCNMTAEGQYCPVHGLSECGYTESMGATVAGSMPPVMDESSRDPMDHRGAVTDSFYENTLARLKKLALGK